MEHSGDPIEPTVERIAQLESEVQRLRSSEREALAVKDEIERREASLRRDVSKLSHDLRNGLGGILGFAALLREEEDLSEQQREDVTDIYNAGHKMLERLNEMRDKLTRPDDNEPSA